MRISDWSSDVCSSDLKALLHSWNSFFDLFPLTRIFLGIDHFLQASDVASDLNQLSKFNATHIRPCPSGITSFLHDVGSKGHKIRKHPIWPHYLHQQAGPDTFQIGQEYGGERGGTNE